MDDEAAFRHGGPLAPRAPLGHEISNKKELVEGLRQDTVDTPKRRVTMACSNCKVLRRKVNIIPVLPDILQVCAYTLLTF